MIPIYFWYLEVYSQQTSIHWFTWQSSHEGMQARRMVTAVYIAIGSEQYKDSTDCSSLFFNQLTAVVGCGVIAEPIEAIASMMVVLIELNLKIELNETEIYKYSLSTFAQGLTLSSSS